MARQSQIQKILWQVVQFFTNNPPRGEKAYSMTNQTNQAVENTLAAIDASEYIVRLIHEDKPPINKKIEPYQLIKEISYYQAKNREGYNIYFRPVGYEYVLLDDLQRAVLAKLAQIKPCLLIETSPANYQAWVKLKDTPQEKEEALAICVEMAAMFDADMASAEPVHLGRLPGFTNRKPKHEMPGGLFPFVILHKHENRESDFSPQGGIVGQTIHVPGHRRKADDHDRSRGDFNLACMLISQGKPDDFIRQRLEETSEKAKEVRQSYDYIKKTIRSARIRLGR